MDSIKQFIKNLNILRGNQEANNLITCDNLCMYTACLIMAVAVFLQCRAQEATIFNTMLLLLGVTSVIHHSRLSKWIINDAVRFFDIFIVVTITIIGCFRYNWNILWILTMLYGVGVIGGGCWCNLIPEKAICKWHASVHVLFIGAILILELSSKEKFTLKNKDAK